jgi:hypothetical protein
MPGSSQIKSGHDERVSEGEVEDRITSIFKQRHRHCGPPGRANARQMTGSAKQFIAVIPGWSEGPGPESRDSGFDASHRPGMTVSAPVPNMTS